MQFTIDEIDSLLLKKAEEEIIEETDPNKKEPALRKTIDTAMDAAKTVGGAALAIPALLGNVNAHMPLQGVSE